jgi:hypothetical protein
MKIGAAMFFPDYSMAPEHSHIPLARTASYPGGCALPREGYEVMDPFVTLTAAADATKKLPLGTGICLVVQLDRIQTAKAVATIDHISGGRFLFGVGNGSLATSCAQALCRCWCVDPAIPQIGGRSRAPSRKFVHHHLGREGRPRSANGGPRPWRCARGPQPCFSKAR